jgi:hypothetical protein
MKLLAKAMGMGTMKMGSMLPRYYRDVGERPPELGTLATSSSVPVKLTIRELLSAIIATPLLGSSDSNGIWDRPDVDQAGHRFLTWMHEVRHRGTFTKLATAFSSLVQVVKGSAGLRDLCTRWLDVSLSYLSMVSILTM